MKLRRRARILALQALFETDVAHHDAQRALQERLEETPLSPEGVAFAVALLECVASHLTALDETIRQMAPHWPLEQMSRIDVNILRLGIAELVFMKETPVKVAINEAVEVAKLFGSDSSGRFVNGVLGAVAKQQAPVSRQEDHQT
jgi:N utilization substance protein B